MNVIAAVIVFVAVMAFVIHCPIFKPWFGFRRPTGHKGHWFMSLFLALLLISPLSAQEPVRPVPDAISWGTAAAGPAIAVVRAIRGDDTKCELARLAVGAGIVNGTGLLLQHFVHSPRPCCAGNGLPSLHVANSSVGLLATPGGWRLGLSVGLILGTAAGRVEANRHTKAQAWGWGPLVGVGGDVASHFLVRCGL
jgi:hypothetical protein